MGWFFFSSLRNSLRLQKGYITNKKILSGIKPGLYGLRKCIYSIQWKQKYKESGPLYTETRLVPFPPHNCGQAFRNGQNGFPLISREKKRLRIRYFKCFSLGWIQLGGGGGAGGKAQLAWIPKTFTLLSWGCLAFTMHMPNFHVLQEEKNLLETWSLWAQVLTCVDCKRE